MGKFQVSVKLDVDEFKCLSTMASKGFDGDKAQTIRWLIKTVDPEGFYAMMARYHASQLNHLREVLTLIQEEKAGKEKKTDNNTLGAAWLGKE